MSHENVRGIMQEAGINATTKGDFVVIHWKEMAALIEHQRTKAAEAEIDGCAKVCKDAISNIGEVVIIGYERRDEGINVCSNLEKRILARKAHLKSQG